MTCAGCFHHSLYYYCIFSFFFFFFTPESTLNDGAGCGSIRWPHIRMPLLFLAVLHEKKKKKKAESFVIDFFFPLPRLQITLPLIPLGARREKRGQLHLRLPNKCITVWVLCPGLSGPLTWNVPMRQSGATGAWRLAAVRDNLLWGGGEGLSTPLVTTFSKTPRHARAMWHDGRVSKQLLSTSNICGFIVWACLTIPAWLTQRVECCEILFSPKGRKFHFYQEKVMSNVPASQEMHQRT